MTDSKTAEQIISEICEDYLQITDKPGAPPMKKRLIEAMKCYASDKDKRIAELVEQMNAIRENFIEADTQVASLKSSLAEKEAEIATLKQIKQSLERSLGDAI